MFLYDLLSNLTAVLLLLGFAAMPIFVILLWKDNTKVASAFLALIFFENILMALTSIYTFGGAFGVGILLLCASPLAMIISLMVFLAVRQTFYRRFSEDRDRRRFYMTGGLLLVLFQLIPFVGHFTIKTGCYMVDQQIGEAIVASMEFYRDNNHQYPQSLTDLVPEYLPILPPPACFWLSPEQVTGRNWYALQTCPPPGEELLLTVRSVDGSSIERYNFATGNWSSISFLDGVCNFLR